MLYLSRDSHEELYILYKQSGSVLSVLLPVFYTYQSVNKTQILGHLTHLLNKQIVFFDKMCQ